MKEPEEPSSTFWEACSRFSKPDSLVREPAELNSLVWELEEPYSSYAGAQLTSIGAPLKSYVGALLIILSYYKNPSNPNACHFHLFFKQSVKFLGVKNLRQPPPTVNHPLPTTCTRIQSATSWKKRLYLHMFDIIWSMVNTVRSMILGPPFLRNP